MKHEEHICRFNDGEQSCDCYDKGYEKAKEELLAKSKEQGWCECCGADLPKLSLPISKWEE